MFESVKQFCENLLNENSNPLNALSHPHDFFNLDHLFSSNECETQINQKNEKCCKLML